MGQRVRYMTRRNARIDLGSILAYVHVEVLASDQSYCMIITCESHMRNGVSEDKRQWVEAIGVANARHAELWTALRAATQRSAKWHDATQDQASYCELGLTDDGDNVMFSAL